MVVKRWTPEDEEFIIQNYSKLTNRELSDKFGVSAIAIQRKLARLKLMRQFQKKWTDEEEKFLREKYSEMSDKALAKVFNVTEISIKRKLARLGFKRNLRVKSAAHASSSAISREFPGKAKIASGVSQKATKPKISAVASIGPRKNSGEKIVESKLAEIQAAPLAVKDLIIEAKEEFKTAPEKSLKLNGSVKTHREEKQYAASELYEIGDLIFHKAWADRGKVVKIIETSGGNRAIVVDFNKHGKRTLIEGIKEKQMPNY
ncbi:MAG TPA: hypothetical protein PKK26_10700 [Candidatus Wallbacteria bacterium]|nr:hypothetical protein [Candidatus Wallbacteria bacterium]